MTYSSFHQRDGGAWVPLAMMDSNENVTLGHKKGAESGGAHGFLTVLSLKDEADPTWTLVIGTGLPV